MLLNAQFVHITPSLKQCPPTDAYNIRTEFQKEINVLIPDLTREPMFNSRPSGYLSTYQGPRDSLESKQTCHLLE